MKELQVVAQQTPGTIDWNFEELKERLSEEMKRYEKIVYTDENIKEAKSDIAGLRKLQKEVNDRKIEIKKTWLLPYDAFEAQVNELKAIIEKPIAMIDEKVKDYEARRKKATLERIRTYFNEAAAKLPETIREKAFGKIYQDKWLNATAKVSEWKSGIDSGIESILQDYQTINTMPGDFVKEGVEKYEASLMLNEAIQYMNVLQRQKQIAEERVAQEQREKEERERIAREQAAMRAGEAALQGMKDGIENPDKNLSDQVRDFANASNGSNTHKNTAHEENTAHEPEKAAISQNEVEKGFLLRLFSEKDMQKLVEFCEFSEIRYEVVK